MENIWQAVEKARGDRRRTGGAGASSRRLEPAYERWAASEAQDAVLNSAFLQSNRIISHLVGEPLAKSFDMLRTQILQSMDLKGWNVIAVTSPTPACGKTVTAVNLAVSIARQRERSALLVDLDLQRPSVGKYLGLEFEAGTLGILDGRTTLSHAIMRVRIDDYAFMVLPTASTVGSSELMASRGMMGMLEDLRKDYPAETIIIDLPPVLAGDDVISLLPHVNCVLLVVGVGTSTLSQIEECNRHLRSAEIVKVVLNKVPEATSNYYYY